MRNEEGTYPSDEAAERAVLGAILLDRDAISEAAARLKPGMFYVPANADTFAAMTAVAARREPVDVLTVSAELDGKGKLEAVGGRTFVMGLACEVATSANMSGHIGVVRLESSRREAMMAARRIIGKAPESDDPASDFRSEAASLTASGTGRKLSGSVVEWMDELDYVDGLVSAKRKPMFTGARALDDIMGGMHRGELSFVAARPGVGKTTLALAFAKFMARNGFRPAFVTAEMGITALLDRVLAMECGRPVRRYRSGQDQLPVGSPQSVSVSEGIGRMSEMDMLMVNAHGMTPAAIRAELIRSRSQGVGPDIVFVDYIQLLRPEGKSKDNRNEELSSISRSLNEMADELDCHVCAMSQLSRDAAAGEPQLHHLRDSGCLEQDAHQVVMAWKPTAQLVVSTDRAQTVNVKVAKNRDGMTGSCTLKVDFASYSIVG